MKYRKIALIEAEQFNGSDEMIKKYHIEFDDAYVCPFRLETQDGWLGVSINDWIATDNGGKYWPILDDVFKKTYEEVKFGCKYCQQDEVLMQTESGTLMLIDDMLIEVVTWDDYNDCPSDKVMTSKIKYCPMCGRKLEE